MGAITKRSWNYWAIMLLTWLWCMSPATAAWSGIWDIDPLPPANGDPQWEQVKALWAHHYDGKNLTELIAVLTSLKDAYPQNIEPYVWLARVHYLHARYHRKDRQKHFTQAEEYAAKACAMDSGNITALKILVDICIHSRNRSYIYHHYGSLIRGNAPLPYGEALPEMKAYTGWNTFQKLWQARADIEKAKAAAGIADQFAREHPRDGLAQAWAARANYYLGENFTSSGEHNTKALPYYQKGIVHGAKARSLMPDSVAANFWYQLNLARSLQFTSMLNKARYLTDMLNPLLFCSRENSTYNYFGPAQTLGTMITNGGWITEKGMQMAGVSLETALAALELTEILYPDYYYAPYCRADILAYQGKQQEALAILEKLLVRNPDANAFIPENRFYLRFARTLHDTLEKGE